MVHALQQVHKLLRPGGWLVSVHDLPTPHVIEVHAPGVIQKVGWLLQKDDFLSTRSALNALAQVVADGFYSLEDQQDYVFNIFGDSVDELREWLADWWESAVLTDGVNSQLEKLVRKTSPPVRVVLSLRARMTKLKAIQQE